MTIEQNKGVIRDLIEENSVDGIDELCALNFVGHLPYFPVPVGKAEFLEFAKMLFTAFPDLNHDIEFQVAENDIVTSCINVSGTHLGEFKVGENEGIPATGNKVEFYDLLIARMENGKAVEIWAQLDALGLLRQLGAPFLK
ncbi:ester cyclase [Dehalobacterium formicoaceticum]|uniref:ester cyclase n=1 Tax=Dehalobacterium formicoaceticum TaxID=51515 RepID=UPI000B7F1F6D|nr:ester cyclase [Dehalobacterium formicoaceticum]